MASLVACDCCNRLVPTDALVESEEWVALCDGCALEMNLASERLTARDLMIEAAWKGDRGL